VFGPVLTASHGGPDGVDDYEPDRRLPGRGEFCNEGLKVADNSDFTNGALFLAVTTETRGNGVMGTQYVDVLQLIAADVTQRTDANPEGVAFI
jgi:hypothetical protein